MKQGVVALDANVLLNFYEASPDLRESRIRILTALDDRVFIPHQVKEEFHRRREDSAQRVSQDYATVRAAASQLRKAGAAFGKSNAATSKDRDRRSIEDVRTRVDGAVSDLLDALS
jgi:rRNA-processing protein FCF1